MISRMAVRKWSVSVDEELASRVEEHVNDRGLSSFVARAAAESLDAHRWNVAAGSAVTAGTNASARGVCRFYDRDDQDRP
jgi:metal-responsive CopG/Arc/MetJ family transcriptional regulator